MLEDTYLDAPNHPARVVEDTTEKLMATMMGKRQLVEAWSGDVGSMPIKVPLEDDNLLLLLREEGFEHRLLLDDAKIPALLLLETFTQDAKTKVPPGYWLRWG
jgi:hypothetical protein